MYPRSFLCEEAKIKQHTSSEKELCEIGEEAIWGSQFTCFLNIWIKSSYWVKYILTLQKAKVIQAKVQSAHFKPVNFLTSDDLRYDFGLSSVGDQFIEL